MKPYNLYSILYVLPETWLVFGFQSAFPSLVLVIPISGHKVKFLPRFLHFWRKEERKVHVHFILFCSCKLINISTFLFPSQTNLGPDKTREERGTTTILLAIFLHFFLQLSIFTYLMHCEGGTGQFNKSMAYFISFPFSSFFLQSSWCCCTPWKM